MSVAAVTVWYPGAIGAIMAANLDLTTVATHGEDIKMALLSPGYTMDPDADFDFSACVANELGGGTPPTGYTNGGQSMSSLGITYDSATNTWHWDAADMIWTGLDYTAGVDTAIIYDDTSNTLICCITFPTQTGSGNFELDFNLGHVAPVPVS